VLNTSPTITPPANISVAATSASGAVVSFTATADDLEDVAITPVCTPASGSTFPIGETTVTCTATDSEGNSVSGTFVVTVRNTAPVLSVPANVSVTASSASGAPVTFAATALDTQDGRLTPVCTPASGTTFVVGMTTVTCRVVDSLGLSDSATFVVTVAAPPAPASELPATGASPQRVAVVGMGALVGGLGLMAVSHRRRKV
jgi:LPXTG-motif cell wall-anchored protein